MLPEERAVGKAFFKVCNICKKEIPFCSAYYRCTVSTCRSKRTGFFFCSISCYDGHIGFMRHRNSECEEEIAPPQ
jgi:hypothetical protein